MSYFKMNELDFSHLVKSLKVNKQVKYNSQTNAAGGTVVDYIGAKRTIEVGIIPLDSTELMQLQSILDDFTITLGFMNPETGKIEEGVQCILPSNNIEYYTIQADKVLCKAFNLQFTEL